VHVGGAVDAGISGRGTFPSIAAVGGVPYVAWQEQPIGPITQVYVAHWSGSAWVDDGDPLNSNPANSAGPATITGIGSVPYVAWSEDNGSGQDELFVAHYSAGSWNEDVSGYVNSAMTTPTIDGTPQIADVGGTPYVTFAENDAGVDDLYAGFVSGGEFVPLGAVLNEFSGQEAFDPSITDLGGTPVYLVHAYGPWRKGTAVRHAMERHGLGAGRRGAEHRAIATDNGALLAVRVRDYDTSLPIGFQYGRGSSLGTSTTPAMTGGTGSDTIIQAISGLSPSTRYSWRAYATDGSVDTAFGPTHIFTTEAASTTGPKGKAGKIEVVTCRQTRSHGVTVEQCTGKLVSTPVEVAAEQIRAGRLSRGERLYATVEVLRRRDGRMRLLIVHRVRRLSRGSYTLRTRSGRTTVRLS
jgi:hypothetical protein